MSVREIIALGELLGPHVNEPGCHLYLWATNNYLPDALGVMEAWGFTYKTMITRVKDRMGLGQYYRGLTEHCLFGVRNCLPYKTAPTGIRAQGVTAFYAPRSIHSRKPAEMREMIERVSHAPRLEFFARSPQQGWDVWGNEVESTIALAA